MLNRRRKLILNTTYGIKSKTIFAFLASIKHISGGRARPSIFQYVLRKSYRGYIRQLGDRSFWDMVDVMHAPVEYLKISSPRNYTSVKQASRFTGQAAQALVESPERSSASEFLISLTQIKGLRS